jgi:hypothetical protein
MQNIVSSLTLADNVAIGVQEPKTRADESFRGCWTEHREWR